ncbi:alanine racemase [Paraglaciecola aestuariivivens]
MPRQTRATIFLDAIIHNYKLANKQAPLSQNIAVIKADAYGHGSIKVAKALAPYVPAFAVAIFEEAVSLKEAGITQPILVLQGINSAEELIFASQNNIWSMLENEQQLALIVEHPLSQPIHLWLKVDTGMHRLGLDAQGLPKVLDKLAQCPWVKGPLVLSSHLACASNLSSQASLRQLAYFSQVTQDYALPTSLANSAALLGFEQAHRQWNRPGIMLYGLSPFEHSHPQDQYLKPAMSFTSSVMSIRQVKQGEYVGYGETWQAPKTSTIATIAVGYADGYPRHAKNGTPLLINGQMAYLAGRVSMDMITADISHCKDIKIGDPVELWGQQINANQVAKHADTIGYQLLTGVSQRVQRHYA